MYLHSTTLGARIARVAQDVDNAERRPGSAKDRGSDRVRQASNEKRPEEGSEVLGEVGVGALGYSGTEFSLLASPRNGLMELKAASSNSAVHAWERAGRKTKSHTGFVTYRS